MNSSTTPSNCTVCNSSEMSVLYSSPTHPFFTGVKKQPDQAVNFFPLSAYQCQYCGFVCTRSTSAASLKIDEFYRSPVSMTSAPIDQSEHTSKIADRFITIMEDAIKQKSGMRFLEIGCREGSLMAHWQNKYHVEITGIDATITPKNTSLPPLSIINDYFPSPKLNGQFDVIYSKAVVEHIPNLSSFFEGVARHLKPEGYFICQVPETGGSLNAGNIGVFIFEHVNYFTTDTLSFLCAKYGLMPEKVTADNASITIICRLKPADRVQAKKPSLTPHYRPENFTNKINEIAGLIREPEDIGFIGASPDLFNPLYTIIGNKTSALNIYDNDSFKSGQYLGRNTRAITKPIPPLPSRLVPMPFTYHKEITKQIIHQKIATEIINVWNY